MLLSQRKVMAPLVHLKFFTIMQGHLCGICIDVSLCHWLQTLRAWPSSLVPPSPSSPSPSPSPSPSACWCAWACTVSACRESGESQEQFVPHEEKRRGSSCRKQTYSASRGLQAGTCFVQIHYKVAWMLRGGCHPRGLNQQRGVECLKPFGGLDAVTF